MKNSVQTLALNLACPCGRPLSSVNRAQSTRTKVRAYGECCAPYLLDFDNTPAPDAHYLMRSRYTAFVLCHVDYLNATWDPAYRPAYLELDHSTQWLGLDVRSFLTQQESNQAEVEFVARYRLNGRAYRIHERSRFEAKSGRWWYLDGIQTP